MHRIYKGYVTVLTILFFFTALLLAHIWGVHRGEKHCIEVMDQEIKEMLWDILFHHQTPNDTIPETTSGPVVLIDSSLDYKIIKYL